MERENITTPSNEAFIVEAIISIERAPLETTKATSPLMGMIGTTSLMEETRIKVVDSI